MAETIQSSPARSRKGCVFALALILLPMVALAVRSGQFPGEEWPFDLLHGLLLALPFGYLVLDGTKNWFPWLVAIALTAIIWGAVIASAVISARDHSGVNFGMGLILLASPFVTTFGAWLANRRAKSFHSTAPSRE